MTAALTSADVAIAAQLACLLEASAPKPGNVHPGAAFHDARYEDYLASAAALGPAMGEAGRQTLGATIRTAVAATRRWTRANTNLGIVLLFAPLARAALSFGGAPPRESAALRERVRATLDASTVADASDAYAAIRLAAPGGLGAAEAEDVSGEPDVTLRDAMALAAARDAVAGEYASAFALTFELGLPALAAARGDGLAWGDATVEAYLALLAAAPDTLIARKLGFEAAAEVSRGARAALDAGGVRSDAGRRAVARFDHALRDERNTRNPGTTADLVAAALFTALLTGAWHAVPGDRDA